MMETLGRGLAYNMGASFVAGLWVLAVVIAAIRLFAIESAEVRFRLMALPALKSTVVLLGLSTVMPFPGAFWREVQQNALPFETVAPVFLIAVGAGLVVMAWRWGRLRSRLAATTPIDPGTRAGVALRHAVDKLRVASRSGLCCHGYRLREHIPEPRLFLTDGPSLETVTSDDPPSALLPKELEQELDDEELEAVLAHELAHVALRRPTGCCDPLWLRRVAWLNPGAWPADRLLTADEELACDEVAVRATGKPEALASALIKSYKRARPTPALGVAALLGGHGELSRRLTRLIHGGPPKGPESRARLSCAWASVLLAGFVQL